MLNEERIKLMTRMASYEEREGKKNLAIGSYFRSDYISLQVLKSVICATITFAILCGAAVLYDFELFMQDIYKEDLLISGKKILIFYVAFIAIYAVISYIVYSYRYNRAKKSLRQYYSNLKQLSVLYEEESRK
ncbi:MAG: hypothetical protein GX234_06765 [Clostridiales bacterium]|nr:hypothetical protein [Clostridiales bacterium]